MKRIKSYTKYLIESVFYANDDFIKLLNNIDNPIAKILLDLIGNDIKLNFNAINISSKNNLIKFLPDAKVKEEPSDWSKIKNEMRIGRLVKDILVNNNHTEFSDSQIEDFVTKYKAAFELKDKIDERIKVVEGDDIRKWYLVDNYSTLQSGTLKSSCMRYERCQEYFDIYVENSKVCKMVILLNNDNKLEARALLWKLDYSSKNNEYYLDRIYYTSEESKLLIKDWVYKNYENICSYDFGGGSVGKIKVQLNVSDFDEYPYVDSLYHLNKYKNTLANYSENSEDIGLQDTNGGYEESGVYCELEDATYPEEDVIWIENRSCFVHRDNASYSEYTQEYYWRDDVVWGDYDQDYIPTDDSCYSKTQKSYLFNDKSHLVYLESDDSREDYMPSDLEGERFAQDESTGNYYLIHLLVNSGNDNWVLKKNALSCYEDMNDVGEFYTPQDAKIYSIDLNMESQEFFSLEEYYDEQYISKIYDIEVAKIKEFVGKLDLDNDEKESLLEDKLDEYKKWHKIYLLNNYNYKLMHQLYNIGGSKKLYELRKNMVDACLHDIGDDYILYAIKNIINDSAEGEIGFIIKMSTEEVMIEFKKLVYKGLDIDQYSNYDVVYAILKSYQDEKIFYRALFNKIKEAFEEIEIPTIRTTASILINNVYLGIPNSDWVIWQRLYADISPKLVSIVDNSLGII